VVGDDVASQQPIPACAVGGDTFEHGKDCPQEEVLNAEPACLLQPNCLPTMLAY
jgi:hypothetical protein